MRSELYANVNRVFLAVLVALGLLMVFTGVSRAEDNALVILHDNGATTYDRAARVQQSFLADDRFASTRVVTDAAVHEVRALVRRFLQAPGKEGDRRFVWVSGLGGESGLCHGSPSSYEDRNGDVPIVPAAASVILGPECVRGWLDHAVLGQNVRVTPSWADLERAPLPATTPLLGGTVAFISLPSDEPKYVVEGDRVVLRFLEHYRHQPVAAVYLFEYLRANFSMDGSRYTPSLAVSSARAAWSTNLFGDVISHPPSSHAGLRPRPMVDGERLHFGGRPLKLYATPDISNPPVRALSPSYAVTLIRKDETGRLGYVRSFDGWYGWVRLDATQYAGRPEARYYEPRY